MHRICNSWGILVSFIAYILGSSAVYSVSTPTNFQEARQRASIPKRLKLNLRQNRRTPKKWWYCLIPVESIENVYRGTENWTEKLQERIREKSAWKKAWHEYNYKTKTPQYNVTIEELSHAMTASDQLAISTKQDRLFPTHVAPEGPTLIIYNYFEAPLNKINAEFFFRHHNPKWADVLLVVNGEEHSLELPLWVTVLPRQNIGLEFCAMMELLPLLLYGKLHYEDTKLLALWKKRYSYFMLLNASVRGPFYPLWPSMESNWVEVFKAQLTKDEWLVGTSFNCMRNKPSLFHLQSFTLMTHRRGLEMIYEDFQQRLLIFNANNQGCDIVGNFSAPKKWSIIFAYEIGMTQTFLSRNISIKSLSLGWQGVDFRSSEAVNKICMTQADQYYRNLYFGNSLNPFEVIFFKTNTAELVRVDMKTLDLYTLWFDKRVGNYTD